MLSISLREYVSDQVGRIRVTVAGRDPVVFFPVLKGYGIEACLGRVVHEIDVESTFHQVVEVFRYERDVKRVG